MYNWARAVAGDSASSHDLGKFPPSTNLRRHLRSPVNVKKIKCYLIRGFAMGTHTNCAPIARCAWGRVQVPKRGPERCTSVMSHFTAAQGLDLLGQLMITDSFAVVIINCVIFVELTRPGSRSQHAPPTCGTDYQPSKIMKIFLFFQGLVSPANKAIRIG
jgi:hypothetical protein